MMFNLATKTREVFGKKTRVLRNKGFIPAELYGHNVENIHISVPEKDFIKVYRDAGEHAIINLAIDDGEKVPVLVSYVHYDTLSEKFLAVDFHQVKMDEKITAQIPIVLKGEAPAIKAGYVLLHVLHEVPIECLPGNIPNKFDIDISRLQNPGDTISVADLKMGSDVKILVHPETVIITAQEKKVQKEEEPVMEASVEIREDGEIKAEMTGENKPAEKK